MITLRRKIETRWQDLITNTRHQVKGISILIKHKKSLAKFGKNFLSDIAKRSHIHQLIFTYFDHFEAYVCSITH